MADESLRVITSTPRTATAVGSSAIESVLFVHGSAADATSWSAQLAALPPRIRGIAYDRRVPVRSVSEHVADAVRIIEERAGAPVVACGSSFGAVVVLELSRSRTDLVRGAVLCEPPLAAGDYLPCMPSGFGCEFDRTVAERGGEAAGEGFLRLAMGDRAFERVPPRWRQRMCAGWEQIRWDSIALVSYRARYAELAGLRLPVLLVGGERSTPYFSVTLDALEQALSSARRVTVRGAGHVVHMDAPARFDRELLRFCDFGLPTVGPA